MRTHRPWQPHLSNNPLFNPFAPSTERVTLDRIEIADEEEDEGSTPIEPAEQADDQKSAG
jgi:hypothetical protein